MCDIMEAPDGTEDNAMWNSSEEFPLWLRGLTGFIHHSGQVYTPRPKARTANKLP